MKYDVVSQHDLIAHALGKKDSIEEPEKDTPKPKPAPPAPAKKTKPSPKSNPEPAKKPAPAPPAKKAPAPAPAKPASKADPVVYDVTIDAQITAEPKKDSSPA